jgi:hypothetical protein
MGPKKTRIAEGIRQDGLAFEAYVKRGGKQAGKRFPAGTAMAQIHRWRKKAALDLEMGRDLLPESPIPKLKSIPGWCYVYFVQSEDDIKIGRAKDVRERMRALQAGHPRPLRVLAAVAAHPDMEAACHERFAHLRQGESEWFRLAPDLMKFIEAVRKGTNPMALLFDPWWPLTESLLKTERPPSQPLQHD